MTKAAKRKASIASIEARRRENTRKAELESQKHNGWTNYETWCVNLWLTNEEPSYRYWRDLAKSAMSHAHSDREQAASELAAHLREEVSECRPTEFLNSDGMNHGASGMYADLLGAALSEVNWYEIAKAFLEE